MSKVIISLIMCVFIFFTSGCKELEELANSDANKNSDTTASSEANAVEATLNKVFDGRTRLKVSSVGVAFTIPDGWRGALGEAGFALESQEIGYIVITADDSNETQTRETMSNTLDLGDGIYLQPDSQIEKRGNILYAEYEVYGTNQPGVGYVVKVFGQNGKGFAVLGFGLPSQKSALITAADEIVNSLAFFQASTTAKINPSTPASGDSSNYWSKQLAGLRLTYFNTQTGFSEKFVIVLCGDGSFSRSANTSGFDNSGFSAALQNGGDGRWVTSGTENSGSLQLNYNNGDIGSYNIEVNDEGLFLNGERYFREDAGC